MKISVVIVTYNRCSILKTVIEKFLEQTYKNIEIIVVDNFSTDDTEQMIRDNFPQIKYLRLIENFEIRAINIGISLAEGDIIWRTDDDSHPENEFVFEKVIEIFKNNSDIHGICARNIDIHIGNNEQNWYFDKVDLNNIPPNGYPAYTFAGTGAAIKREVFDKVGGFWGFGMEEIDFTTKSRIAGYDFRYFPNIIVHHHAFKAGRIQGFRWTLYSSQLIRFIFKYYPLFYSFLSSIVIILTQILFAIYWRIGFKDLILGIATIKYAMWKSIFYERNPIPKQLLPEFYKNQRIVKIQFIWIWDRLKNKLKKKK